MLDLANAAVDVLDLSEDQADASPRQVWQGRATRLLAIPRTVYMRFWHFAHTPNSLRAAVAELGLSGEARPAAERQGASG